MKQLVQHRPLALGLALTLLTCAPVFAGNPPGLSAPHAEVSGSFKARDHYSPYAGRNFPRNVYWGDTHLHTGISMDAGAFAARVMPKDAYRLALGEELTASTYTSPIWYTPQG